MDLFIDSYEFGVKSLICPEYGLRHLEKAKSVDGFGRLAHRVIGIIECCPVLGHAVSLIEGVVHHFFASSDKALKNKKKLGYGAGKEEVGVSNKAAPDKSFVSLDDCSIFRSLNGQPAILLEKFIENEVQSYDLVRFVWMQWALKTFSEKQNWDHVKESGFNQDKLGECWNKFKEKNLESFEPFVFTKEEILELSTDSSEDNVEVLSVLEKRDPGTSNLGAWKWIWVHTASYLKTSGDLDFMQNPVIQTAKGSLSTVR